MVNSNIEIIQSGMTDGLHEVNEDLIIQVDASE